MFSLMIRRLAAPASLLFGIFALPPAPREVEIVPPRYMLDMFGNLTSVAIRRSASADGWLPRRRRSCWRQE